MECWYCKQAQLESSDELGKGWSKCPKCGATYVKMLRVGASPITMGKNYATGRREYKSVRRVKKTKVKK